MREQITLWHATQIGQDGARLRSILENGLTLSQEFVTYAYIGQRRGIFAWNSDEHAQIHAAWLSRNYPEHGQTAIAEINAPTDMKQWDFDYELGIRTLERFFDELEPLIMETDFSDVLIDEPRGRMFGQMEFACINFVGNDLSFVFTRQENGLTNNIHFSRSALPKTVILEEAPAFEAIFTRVRETFPKEFDDILDKAMRAQHTNGSAFKYIGSDSLPISYVKYMLAHPN